MVYQVFLNINKLHRMLYFKLNINITYFLRNFSLLLRPTFTQLAKKGPFSVLTSTYCIYKRRHLKIHYRAANSMSSTIS